MTPDVNVLVAAFRSDHAHHPVARAWLEGAVSATQAGSGLTLIPMVVASFLRLVTSPKIFPDVTPVEDAIAFIDALLLTPRAKLAALGPEWPTLRQLCLGLHLSGNNLPDAWLAAAVLHRGEHLVSFDRDFKKLLPRSRFTLLATA